MKSILLTAATVAALITAGAVSAQNAPDGAALAQKHGCFNCHDVDTKKVGPPLKEGAAKLKGKSDADAVAALKGVQAHSGVKASDEDLKAMNTWMQSGFARAAM